MKNKKSVFTKFATKPAFYIIIAVIAIAAYIFNTADNTLNIFGDDSATNGDGKSKIEIHYIDVGQGDAALILTDAGSVLIDAGTTQSGDLVASYTENRTDEIDYMILSHPHEDHIGGAGAVLDRIPVKNVVMPDRTADTVCFDRLLMGIEESKANVIPAEKGKGIALGELRMEFLSPDPAEDYEEVNNVSAVVRITYGDTSFLFTGDAEAIVENQILKSGQKVKCDVLKVGHHGSSSSSTEDFIKAVNPKIAVISCGKNNSYGHPHAETRELLEKRGIDYYRTDRNGTVVVVSDGSAVSVKK